MNFSSRLIENAVNEISRLPGIGKKTALRLVLHLLRQQPEDVHALAGALTTLRDDIRYCRSCNNISDKDVCEICSNPSRDASVICVVEDTRDVMAIENTNQYKGLYHVLGGLISPMDGIGPSDLHIPGLLQKVQSGQVRELIFALSTTMEGDTTNFYIFKKLPVGAELTVSTIARGISVGDELEYADEITLGRSIRNRIPYETTMR